MEDAAIVLHNRRFSNEYFLSAGVGDLPNTSKHETVFARLLALSKIHILQPLSHSNILY